MRERSCRPPFKLKPTHKRSLFFIFAEKLTFVRGFWRAQGGGALMTVCGAERTVPPYRSVGTYVPRSSLLLVMCDLGKAVSIEHEQLAAAYAFDKALTDELRHVT